MKKSTGEWRADKKFIRPSMTTGSIRAGCNFRADRADSLKLILSEIFLWDFFRWKVPLAHATNTP
jgi:hypothetical protein